MNENRKHILDFIKGLCIIFVIITHFSWSDKERLYPVFPYLIDMAVPIFMVISGYLWASSLMLKTTTFTDAYKMDYIMPRLRRYLFPFTVAFIVEIVPYYIFVNKGGGVIAFVQGGYGPGSYYVPILIQLIFIFPVIFWMIRKHDLLGLVICILINLFYEAIKDLYGVTEECYRLLVFRYITELSFGCYFAIGKRKIKKIWKYAIGIVGGLFIFITTYTEYETVIFKYWTGTSMISCLYIIPVMKFLINCKSLRCKFMEYIGRYSYEIYLVQMVYYFALSGFVKSNFDNRFIQLLVGLIICIAGGVIFGIIVGAILGHLPKRDVNYYQRIERKVEFWINKVFERI